MPGYAQTTTEQRVWTAVSLQGHVGGSDSPWRWAADSLLRTRDGARTMDFAGEWISVGRSLTGRSVVGVGYAYGAGFPDTGSVREHRFIQQYTWTAGSAWRVSSRTRVEERFLSGRPGMLVRVREQVRATWPLASRGMLRGVLSGEVLVRANSPIWLSRGFDSSRVFVGVGRKVSRRSLVETGYEHVYTAGASGIGQHSHILSATVILSM